MNIFINLQCKDSSVSCSPQHTLLREKCANTEFFLVRIFLYSDWIQKYKDQKKLRIWTLFTQCSSKGLLPETTKNYKYDQPLSYQQRSLMKS